MEPMTASADRIDLWLARCADLAGDLPTKYRELLSDGEQRAEQRFYFERDRRRYLMTRALVRTVLSRYADIAPRAWRFRCNRYGRPEIANATGATQALSFNVSHTSELVLLGVTLESCIGVDIEMVRDIEPLDLAERFFAPAEIGALAGVVADRQRERFFEFWTLKESYIKARGLGLTLPLDSFSFDLSAAGRIRFSSLTASKGGASEWRFWQLRPANDHVAAVCVRHASACREQVSLRTILPLRAELPVDVVLLRTSDKLSEGGHVDSEYATGAVRSHPTAPGL
jgi:4'-phosphopantetheinyl transferase